MPDIAELIAYYVNLLIIQYHNQPKAMATIALFVQEALAEGVYFAVQNAYNIIGTDLTWDGGETWDDGGMWDEQAGIAVGPQLDVIGKYVGVDRFYSELILENYFSLITYDETGMLPTSPPRFGFTDYANYGAYQYSGTLVYNDLIAFQNQLYDNNFYTLIQLAIILNNSNFSYGSIDKAMYDFFGLDIRPESSGNMLITYFVNSGSSPLIEAMIAKNLLPAPMGVAVRTVSDVTGLMFAFTDYSGYFSPYGYGFSDYSNYDTLAGQDLIYAQIT